MASADYRNFMRSLLSNHFIHLFFRFIFNLRLMRFFVVFCVFTFVLFGCSSVKNLAVETDISRTLNQSTLFDSQFTGFSLYDIEEDKFIAGYNDTKRFTPTSNVKLLTLYASLKSLKDSIPGLLYQEEADTLWIQPVGDPSFLNDDFPDQPIYNYLSGIDSARIIWPSNDVTAFAPGWAWEDYSYRFQTQRSWWPVYENNISIIKRKDSIEVTPDFFQDYVEVIKKRRAGEQVERDQKYNLFKVYTDNDTSTFKRNIPFDHSQELLLELLSDTLQKEFAFDEKVLLSPDTLFSQPLDTVLAQMMKTNNNFLAEQLLMQAAWKNGYTAIDPFIKHVKLIWLSDLNDFVWVDGSGLSRYNLIAPVDVIRLLKKLHDEFGRDRVLNLFAKGDEPGTSLEGWYFAEEPYLFAKPGSIRNNYCLSGFIRTRSNKWMLFSFFNNHFTVPQNEVKSAVQELLEDIKNTY